MSDTRLIRWHKDRCDAGIGIRWVTIAGIVAVCLAGFLSVGFDRLPATRAESPASKAPGAPDALFDASKVRQASSATAEPPQGQVHADTRPWPPSDALAGMAVPKGFAVSLIAAEPAVAQPIAIAFDDRGRLWVAECRSYGWPKWTDVRSDRVLIFEDRDADGVFETRRVFCDGLNRLTGIAVGLGGAWLACSPELLFVPDRDRDGVPDGPATAVLDGWNPNVLYPHCLFNHLKWGPDGWLYGCVGCLTHSNVAPPEIALPLDRTDLDAGIWRYHPQTRRFEVVAAGTCNPQGIDFDEYGECFVTNNIIGHLWHILPGGQYELSTLPWHGQHAEPKSYELMTMCADHRHWSAGKSADKQGEAQAVGGGHSHAGLTIYAGGNWPDAYRGVALMGNIHGRRITYDVFDRKSDEVVAHHGGDLLTAKDAGFRTVDSTCGPDGALYFCDWSATGECHQTDEPGAEPTGRIYRVAYGNAQPAAVDVSKSSDAQLVAMQSHANNWFSRAARLVLQDRANRGSLEPATVGRIEQLLNDDSRPIEVRLRALWALHVVGGLRDGAQWTALFRNREPKIRAWAVRLAVEPRPVPAEQVRMLLLQATTDNSPAVRRELISALHRLAPSDRIEMAQVLLPRLSDRLPRNWQRMAWYSLELALAERPVDAAKLSEKTTATFLNLAIARRLAALWTDEPQGTNAVAMRELLSRLPGAPENWQTATLLGLGAGLRPNGPPPPEAWNRVNRQLESGTSQNVQEALDIVCGKFGGDQAWDRLSSIVTDPSQSSRRRQFALTEFLSAPDRERILTLLFQMLSDMDAGISRSSILALGAFFDERVPDKLFEVYDKLDMSRKQAAIEVLASNRYYATRLLDRCESGDIPASDIHVVARQQLLALGDERIARRAQSVSRNAPSRYGDSTEEMIETAKLLDPVSLTGADPRAGREVFRRTCAGCHILFGDGRSVGPNLTEVRRDNILRLLEDIIDPNRAVGVQFQTTVVQTTAGRVIVGLLQSENDKSLTVATLNDTIVVDKATVEDRKLLPKSIMPDGLLRQLSQRELCDLFVYLMSPAPPL